MELNVFGNKIGNEGCAALIAAINVPSIFIMLSEALAREGGEGERGRVVFEERLGHRERQVTAPSARQRCANLFAALSEEPPARELAAREKKRFR